jgi:FkbM family methyltransferase
MIKTFVRFGLSKFRRLITFILLKSGRLKLLMLICRLSWGGAPIRQWCEVVIRSNSQIFQELFVLSALDFKDGYFVEVGGTDGLLLSNTTLLEKFGWKGVLFEPCRFWHENLEKNRTCVLDFRAVTSLDHQLISFSETLIPELSTITSQKPKDSWQASRVTSLDYSVKTITLSTAFRELGLPSDLEYLSIDTEGSELDVLAGLNMQEFRFKVITVEHAYETAKRVKVKSMLEERDYVQVFEGKTFWDDWYLHRSLFDELASIGRISNPD